MDTWKRELIRGALVLVAGLSLGLAATAGWSDGGNETCFETTRVMHKACRADVTDDFYEESAKCLNSADTLECRGEVREEYQEAWADCWEQAESRDSLCERLPDAGPYIAEIDPANFAGGCPQGNEFYPLVPGTVTTFVNDTEDEEETIVVTVTNETREIEGIETIVVRDTVYEGLPDDDGNPDGDRIEDTDDYYAVDNDCNVWYLGEVSQSFEDGYLDSLEGSFIAGVDGAQAGIIMLGNPMVGDVYRQEFALGDAEDAGAVLSLETDILDEDGNIVTLDFPFDCEGKCLKTEDFIANEPDGTEYKFFKVGVGFVAEQLPDGEVVLKIIKEERP